MHMKMSISSSISKFLIIVIILLGFSSINIDATCLESEKQALIEFKKGLKDPSNRLSYWIDDVDCCKWEGVVCSNTSGHVIQLSLQNAGLVISDQPMSLATYTIYYMSELSGKIRPSLPNLTHLRHLDLSLNNFKGIPIPRFLGSLKSLRYLNLSKAGFGGMVPPQLGNLSILRTLSVSSLRTLSVSSFRNSSVSRLGTPSYLYVDNLQWLASLSNLEHLDLSDVNLETASNWLQVINVLPSLVELHLSNCHHIQLSQSIDANFSSLIVLDLSGNDFGYLIPRWIFGLTALVSLDLSDNNFETPWPKGPWNLTSLKSLDLSYNMFYSFLPNQLFTLASLISLDLGMNYLQGSIPSTIANISNLQYLDLTFNYLNSTLPNELFTLDDLNTLSLSANRFIGPIPSTVGNSTKLRFLRLSGNALSGSIPLNIGRLSSLETLYIHRNQLTGTLPEILGQLSKLEDLAISDNLLEGLVSESLLDNLKNLRYFYASGNSLSLQVSASWIPHAQFVTLQLGSWKLGPQFPTWLQSQKKLYQLDLSYTGISGTIPPWFWNISMQFQILNLSHNHLHGEISNSSRDVLGWIDLSSNTFNGPLPQSLLSHTVERLDLSNNSLSEGISHFLCHTKNQDFQNLLDYLDLGLNFLSGEIPDCWMKWPQLQYINLDDNNFTGSIPKSMANLEKLKFLHLRNNSLSGKIPFTL